MRPHHPARAVAAAVVLTATLLPAGRAGAQDRDELQVWSALLGTVDTQSAPPDFSLWLDVHARRGAAGTVALVRPGAGVRVTDWLSVWAGYAWIPTSEDAADTLHEHRIWQQVILQHRFDFGLALQSRTRFEQRFHEAGSDVGVRIRQFVRANWQPSPEVPIGIALWDELFVGLNDTDWGALSGIDQNRLFLGPFLQMAPWARLEAGYLFVYLDRGSSDLFAHVVAVNLFVSHTPAPPAADLEPSEPPEAPEPRP